MLKKWAWILSTYRLQRIKQQRIIYQDLPATDDLEWTRQDRWTALMEACNFGHKHIVELLLQTAPNTLDLDAVNIRGQMAEGKILKEIGWK